MTEKLKLLFKDIEGPILIIGASGFVGSSFFHLLSQFNLKIFGTTTNHRNWRSLTLGQEFILLDITQKERLKEVIYQVRPKLILNFAGYGNYHWHLDHEKVIHVNILGLINLLDIVKDLNDVRVINFGSSSEYGDNVSGVSEQAVPDPNSLYGVAKFTISQLIKLYAKQYSVKAIHLRLFSVYGPLEAPDRFIPTLLRSIANNDLPKICKEETSRDFIYIEDVIRATGEVLKNHEKDIWGESYNICSGESTSLKKVLENVKTHYGIDSEISYESSYRRAWDVKSWYGDPHKFEEKFNYRPDTVLIDGLEKTKKLQENIKFSVACENPNKIISLIVACYNDSKNLRELYQQVLETFEQIEYDYELILVDDCSPDETKKVIRELSQSDSRVFGISHTRAFGSQASFLSGMKWSKGEAVVFMDGDLQDPPKLIAQMIEEWKKGFKVIGAKRISRSEPLWLTNCRRAFYYLLSVVSTSPVNRDVGDFSLIDRQVVEQLKQDAKGVFFLRTLRAYYGFSYSEIDYHRPERFHGKSSNNIFKNIWWALFGFFSITNKLSFFASLFLILGVLLLLISNNLSILFSISISFALFVLVNQVYLFMFNHNKLPSFIIKEIIFHGRVKKQ